MNWSRPRTLGAVVALAASALAIAPAAAVAQPAAAQPTAAHAKAPRVLTTGVLAPFQIAVNDGKTYVADGFTGLVSLVNRDGSLTTLAEGLPDLGPGRDVAGLDVVNDGNLWAYTTTQFGTAAQVVIKQKGRPDVVADTQAYEAAKNPDGKKSYGLRPGTDCAAGRAWLGQVTGGLDSYTGIVDSHPYGLAYLGNGSWALADAAANAILKVDSKGKISTIAVLPAQPAVITAALLQSASVDQNGNPLPVPASAGCLVGMTYRFEPVPTDVEVGPDGMLFVTTLPGGPEDPSLGARGSVYKVNPRTGESTRMATGFSGATNLAVTGDGTVFVTELFGGKVTKIQEGGRRTTFATVDSPLSTEVTGEAVYVGTMAAFGSTGQVLAPGSILKYGR